MGLAGHMRIGLFWHGLIWAWAGLRIFRALPGLGVGCALACLGIDCACLGLSL
jgi:hypothetical protein